MPTETLDYCSSVVVVAGLLLWFARLTVETAIVDRKLAHAHVRARCQITELSAGHQRLVDVMIGNPQRPDLTADVIELTTKAVSMA